MEFLLTSAQISWIASRFNAKNIITEFLLYVKKPVYVSENTEMTLKQKVFYVKQLLKFHFSTFLILIPLILLSERITGASFDNGLGDNWSSYFAVVLIAPVIEELIFRNALKYSRFTLAIGIGLGLRFIFKNTLPEDYIPMAVGFSFSSIPLLIIVFKHFNQQIKTFWIQQFPVIFHTIAITFGLVHLLNYEHINNYFLAIPLISSQIISGYILGFVRMKFGILYSISLHITWNFIVSTFLLITLITKLF